LCCEAFVAAAETVKANLEAEKEKVKARDDQIQQLLQE
jgi:hypothetical protein